MGKDIVEGRYWAVECERWTVRGPDGIVTRWNRGMEQSIIDVRDGESIVTDCIWHAGEPPQATLLPTGKLSLRSQLTPGRYRPVADYCFTGPASTRSPNAMLDVPELIEWTPSTPDLVITGNEPWDAYGISVGCINFRRIG